MRAEVLRSVRSLILPTLALAFVLAFVRGEAALAARIYALLLCGFASVLTLKALRRALPPTRRLRLSATQRARGRRTPPEELARIEQEVLLGMAPSDLHRRLRLRLRELASELLEARRRIGLDDDPEAARRILGDEAWQLVRADRPPSEDRFAHGIPVSELARVVESLERI
ncbi:MAG: hypothetical protein E6G20_06300 [Actinobacteria bacterium]|nr:MAG: hypothetical protein E6G20_06300 [Actinomycetota bacterium]